MEGIRCSVPKPYSVVNTKLMALEERHVCLRYDAWINHAFESFFQCVLACWQAHFLIRQAEPRLPRNTLHLVVTAANCGKGYIVQAGSKIQPCEATHGCGWY